MLATLGPQGSPKGTHAQTCTCSDIGTQVYARPNNLMSNPMIPMICIQLSLCLSNSCNRVVG